MRNWIKWRMIGILFLPALTGGCESFLKVTGAEVDTACSGVFKIVEWDLSDTPTVLYDRGEKHALKTIVGNNEYLERHCDKKPPL